ncbi:hypothetical protein BDQ94DRAFT_146799 [Aspergillus welwitschiae]|uniref:Secreted protein n=1 Tax=Aspergillus welwitschiae TaxID=1341132 RepID=A0A3F3PYN3_9EURO|nr:hypothetical protein BDQ94DRAFT_146799 [Aspergillus welwitschiae]RDH31486.1 hypothetical protein BDQ94DRAFT_146799 [Aspergillus welwitschiae]
MEMVAAATITMARLLLLLRTVRSPTKLIPTAAAATTMEAPTLAAALASMSTKRAATTAPAHTKAVPVVVVMAMIRMTTRMMMIARVQILLARCSRMFRACWVAFCGAR